MKNSVTFRHKQKLNIYGPFSFLKKPTEASAVIERKGKITFIRNCDGNKKQRGAPSPSKFEVLNIKKQTHFLASTSIQSFPA